MGKALFADDLKALRKGTKTRIVFTSGGREHVHPARFDGIQDGQAHFLVYWTDAPQQKLRWSLLTDMPVREGRGYIGKARVELDA